MLPKAVIDKIRHSFSRGYRGVGRRLSTRYDWPRVIDSSFRFAPKVRRATKNLRCLLDLSDWRAVHDVTGRGDGKIMAIQMSIESQNLGMSNYGDVRSSRNYTLRGEITDRRTLSS
jgi:hypothetical protein